MKSKVCGGGKETAGGVAGESLIAGVSGADDFGPGVTAVGDLEAITVVGGEIGGEQKTIRGEYPWERTGSQKILIMGLQIAKQC